MKSLGGVTSTVIERERVWEPKVPSIVMVFDDGAVVDAVIVKVEHGEVTNGETRQNFGLICSVKPVCGRTETLTFPLKLFKLVSVIEEDPDVPAWIWIGFGFAEI